MDDYGIRWWDASGTRSLGGFRDGWVALEAARRKAQETGKRIEVLRPDETVFMTVKPRVENLFGPEPVGDPGIS